MHVLAKTHIQAESFVYGTGGVSPDFIPEAYSQRDKVDGCRYMGVADKSILVGQHGTVVVSGVVTLFGKKVPENAYEIVTKNMFDNGEDATLIGITVSCVIHGRFDLTQNIMLQGVRVLLCPWMTACKTMKLGTGFFAELFSEEQCQLFMKKTNYKLRDVGNLEKVVLDVLQTSKTGQCETCYLQ
jgi:hypothetical protein